MIMKAWTKLESYMIAKRSSVCCGLDPDPNLIPQEYRAGPGGLARNVSGFLAEVVNLTGPHVCAYKLQKAFYDAIPSGDAVLAHTINQIKRECPDATIIIDCKAGDVQHTMRSYVSNAFGRFGADALVVNPLMGDDVLRPFAALPEKLGVVLVRTSNPGAAVVQDALMADGRPLWRHILDLLFDRWNTAENLVPVLSCQVAGLPCVRTRVPQETPVFVAGFGAQGGTAQDLSLALNSGLDVVVNASRSILYPYAPAESNWRVAIERAAVQMKTALNTLKGAK